MRDCSKNRAGFDRVLMAVAATFLAVSATSALAQGERSSPAELAIDAAIPRPEPANVPPPTADDFKVESTATVSDTRSGKHTVTVVLLDPPAGRHREFFSSTNNGSGGGGSGTGPLPSGVYSYAIYDLRGLPPHAETEWTPQHQIATGKVTVP